MKKKTTKKVNKTTITTNNTTSFKDRVLVFKTVLVNTLALWQKRLGMETPVITSD